MRQPGGPLSPLPGADERARLVELEQEVARLRKTNKVLLDRVEHRINVEGGAFAAFQAASNLENGSGQDHGITPGKRTAGARTRLATQL